MHSHAVTIYDNTKVGRILDFEASIRALVDTRLEGNQFARMLITPFLEIFECVHSRPRFSRIGDCFSLEQDLAEIFAIPEIAMSEPPKRPVKIVSTVTRQ